MGKSKYFFIIILIIFISTISLSNKAFGEIPTSEFDSYQKENSQYNFKYPPTWKIKEIPTMAYLRVENMDSDTLNSLPKEARKDYFKIEVVTLPSKGLSLNDWVQKQNTTSYPLPKVIEQKNIEVAGQPAIYQIEQFGSFMHPAVFIKKGENIYILNISSMDEKFKEQVEEFINNFQFN